jgi:hypothetical protein
VTIRRFLWALAIVSIFSVTPHFAASQSAASTQSDNSCLSVMGSVGRLSLPDMRAELLDLLRHQPLPAHLDFKAAELMRRMGDYRAPDYYQKAIDADGNEPCYEVFFADYLRNFRGADSPLFPEAEVHYFEGSKKLEERRHDPLHKQADHQTCNYLERGLSALYQQDGVSIFERRFTSDASTLDANTPDTCPVGLKVPWFFLSMIGRYQQSTADLDREADVRDYTSEALFAESSQRLNGPLTEQQLSGMVRTKKAADGRGRIRLRYRQMPAIDVYYSHRQSTNDQITNFYQPDQFNDLRLSVYGISAQKPFPVGHLFDANLTGGFELDQRWGLIEFAAGSEERILNYQTEAAVSRFIGRDKVTGDFSFAHQGIHPEAVPPRPDRYREFIGGKLTYSIFRKLPFLQDAFSKRFETRGLEFFSGLLKDTESFPPNLDSRHDSFVGVSLKGAGPFDFTLQPTWFTSRISNDKSQHNAQLRTNFTTLLRIVDEERKDGIPAVRSGLHLAFLDLVVPFRKDVASAGPNFFENSKVGVELDGKLFTYARWATFLVSARYDHQRFTELEKGKNMFTINLSLGF